MYACVKMEEIGAVTKGYLASLNPFLFIIVLEN